MQAVIYKYALTQLALAPAEPFLVHKGATPLCVQTQLGVPMLWASVPVYAMTAPKMEDAKIEVIPTGRPYDTEGRKYIGTFQVEDGGIPFVFHVFQRAA